MVISELIVKLNEIQAAQGDIRVMIYDSRKDVYTVAKDIRIDEADEMVVLMSSNTLTLDEKFIALE